jgi:hypothetical protein
LVMKSDWDECMAFARRYGYRRRSDVLKLTQELP